MLKISLLPLLRNTLSEIPTIPYTFSSSGITNFTVIIKVARLPVQNGILYGQKQLIKISSLTISQMCLYLTPLFPQFLKFWCVGFGLSLIENVSTGTAAELTLTLQTDDTSRQSRELLVPSVFSSLDSDFRCSVTPSGWTLTFHTFITVKVPTYEFKNWSAQKK